MDPDVTLRNAIDAAKRVREMVDPNQDLTSQIAEWDSETVKEIVTYAERTAMLLTELDEWIRNGGFIPDRWSIKG